LNIELLPEEIYSCGFKVLFDFQKELRIDEIKAKKELINWRPLKISFQSKVFSINNEYWNILSDMLKDRNPNFRTISK
jgi:hypothetical protein